MRGCTSPHGCVRSYRTWVGKPEYTPPELQGQSFTDIHRLPEHDCFGLAILTFQLLMNGSHPFRAQWLNSDEPPPIEERIRQGCYPYVDKPACPVAPPRHSPTLNVLHPTLAHLFQQCFVDGHTTPRQRPSAATWARALAEAETALIPCKNGHYYAQQLPSCPDCETQRVRQRTASAIAAVRRQKTIELATATATTTRMTSHSSHARNSAPTACILPSSSGEPVLVGCTPGAGV